MHPITLHAQSVSEALANGLGILIQDNVVEEQSRNGSVRVWPGPVLTVSQNPLNRVLFSPMRNANPFFHLFESLWMLGGRNDLPWLTQFNKQMKAFSDDGGKTQPAAYGFRWRQYFGYDQIEAIVTELKRDPKTRRAVLAMWDGWGIHTFNDIHHFGDLTAVSNGSADVPCNTQCFFTIREGALHMGVTCRSNDILWGAHGANAAHFSILLEYLAARVGVAVGTMTQFSWNYHLYDGILKYPTEEVILDLITTDRYTLLDPVKPTPIFVDDVDAFDTELPAWLEWAAPLPGEYSDRKRQPAMEHPFLRTTATPMLQAWDAFKRSDLKLACSLTHDIVGADWRQACNEWMQRRYDALYNARGGKV